MEHTKGSWGIKGKSGNECESYIIGAGDKTIAFVTDTYNEETDEQTITETDKANAKLIAAAPEMLEILKTILVDAELALADAWDRTDSGFECQRDTINELLEKITK